MRARRAVLLLLFGFAGIALAGSTAAQAESPITARIETLFAIVLVMAILVGVVVYGALAIALIRFRNSRSAGTPNPSTGNRRLETVWSAVPALILVGITIVSTQTLLFIDTNPANAIQIRVIGQQWSWEFVYPDKTRSSTLYLQRGVTFLFNITSRDVIHSFYLPAFEVKKDAIKGIYNFQWFRSDQAGQYYTQCAEYCGLGHSGMIADVIVFNPQSGRPPYGPPPAAPPTPTAIDLFLEEVSSTVFRIVPANLDLTVNAFVRLQVFNTGAAGHDFTIDAPYNVTTGAIAPGTSAILFLNATQLTTGTAYGGDPADRAKGMAGTLAVAGGRVIDVDLSGGSTTPFRIVPAEIQATLGEVVVFRLHNVATDLGHNFTLRAPYGDVKYDPLIPPGGIATLGPVTLDKEARVTYVCNVPGHAGAGMIGTLIVGNPTPPTPPVVYPFFDFALATFFIVGLAGVGYSVHHAVTGRRRGRGPPE